MKYLIFIFLTGAALAEDLRPAGELFEMEPKWKVRVGDDLAWSARDLNDSTWAAEDSIKTYDGMVWYRQTVVVPTVAGRLAFRVPYVLRAAEFYANGEKVGEHGDIWHWWRQRRDLVEPMLLPASLRPGDRLTLAIRVDKADSGLGVAGIPTLGPVRAVRANYDQQFLRVLRSVLFTVWMGFLPLLTALATLLYWRGRRDRQEALWFGALNLGFFCLDFGAYMSLGATHLWMLLASWGVAFGRWGAWRFFDGSQVIAWRRQIPYLTILSAFALAAALGRSGWIPFRYTLGTSIAVSLLLLIRNAVDAWRRARRGEAWVAWFFAAFLIARAGEVLLLTESFVQWFTELGNPWTLLESPVRVELRSVGELLTGAVMAFLGIRRVLGLARERQALAAEFEAARTVQDLLLTQVPDTRVTGTPGFAVERAYLPAQQVGGDFYFLAPQSDGGLLVLVGDVSGKGLRAAMIVSVAIGAVASAQTSSPGEALALMNAALRGRVAGGFVTCCCLCLSPDGRLRVANAGHLPPYVDGAEAEVPAGLPLGLVPDVAYVETELTVREKVTLLSDGVVEAENAQRELFGFERTREISGKSASEIAAAAKAWGQNDDITVVTVRRMP